MRLRLGVICLLVGVGLGVGRESVVRIDPEHAGVIYRRIAGGTDVKDTLGAGLCFVAPWNHVFTYELREQLVVREVTVLSKDGRPVVGRVAVRFRLQENELGNLHRRVGPNYLETVVWPELVARCRMLLGKFEQNELEAISDEMLKKIEREYADHILSYGIVIEAVRFEEFIPTLELDSGQIAD